MKLHRLDLYSHLSHEMSLADLELIETLDAIRTLLRQRLENPGQRAVQRELHVLMTTFWKALEVRESVAYELSRVASHG